MEKGTVKWFNNAKGFGFICPEGGGEDIFAHYSTIQMDGYRTLKAGQSVQFDVHQGPKGNHASVIVPVEVEAAVAELFCLIVDSLKAKCQPDRLAFLSQKLLSCQSIYWIQSCRISCG